MRNIFCLKFFFQHSSPNVMQMIRGPPRYYSAHIICICSSPLALALVPPGRRKPAGGFIHGRSLPLIIPPIGRILLLNIQVETPRDLPTKAPRVEDICDSEVLRGPSGGEQAARVMGQGPQHRYHVRRAGGREKSFCRTTPSQGPPING